jgi:hypothetical protein
MFGRKRNQEDFSDELRAHLAIEAEQLCKLPSVWREPRP